MKSESTPSQGNQPVSNEFAEDRLLNTEEAAKLLSCSTATIERYVRSGTIPSVKIGRLRRFRRSKLLAFGEHPEASPAP